MDKKGVSQIVTTILIILLVLAAIIIVWQVIDRFVRGGGSAIEEKTGCFYVNLDFVEPLTCDANGIDGSVTRGSDSEGDINMRIVVGNDVTDLSAPVALGTTTFSDLSSGATGDVVVKVAPIIGENLDVICDPTDEVTVTCP